MMLAASSSCAPARPALARAARPLRRQKEAIAAATPSRARGAAGAAAPPTRRANRHCRLAALSTTTAAPPAVVEVEEEEAPTEPKQLRPVAPAAAAAAPAAALAAAPASPPPALAPPPAAFAAAVEAGAAKAALASHAPRLLLLSALAGAYIGMGALLALTVGGGCAGLTAQGLPGLQKLVAGLVGLPTGLTLVLVCGGELVTGNLALCTAAALEGRAKWPQVVRAWLIAYAGNVVGALAVVALAAGAGLLAPGAAAATPAAAAAAAKCALPFSVAVMRGVLANWLVCLAVWMAVSVRDLPSKVLAALLPVSAFVAMGAEHSVANVFIVPAGLVASGAGPGAWADFVACNLVPVTLGNAIGGAVCVASAYWAAFGGAGSAAGGQQKK